MDEEFVDGVTVANFLLMVDELLVSVDVLLNVLTVTVGSDDLFRTVRVGAINVIFMFLVGNVII